MQLLYLDTPPMTNAGAGDPRIPGRRPALVPGRNHRVIGCRALPVQMRRVIAGGGADERDSDSKRGSRREAVRFRPK